MKEIFNIRFIATTNDLAFLGGCQVGSIGRVSTNNRKEYSDVLYECAKENTIFECWITRE